VPVPRGHTNLATVSSTRAHGKEPPIAFSELQPPLPLGLQAHTDRETACTHARIQQSAHARQAPGEKKSYGAMSGIHLAVSQVRSSLIWALTLLRDVPPSVCRRSTAAS
jgi:hypothetical protein